MTKPFHVKIEVDDSGSFRVKYFYNTDMRYDRSYFDLPVREILKWLESQ